MSWALAPDPMSHLDPTAPESPRDPLGERVVSAFRRRFGEPPVWLVRAPGRVNLLGAHVDTSEGWVLPGAIDRAVWLAARPAETGTGILVALDLNDEKPLQPDRLPPSPNQRPAADSIGWIDYLRGVAWALAGAGCEVPALDGVFASDVPIGAGVSSSAAVEAAFLLAWNTAAELDLVRVELARLGRRAENGYLGVASGPMDQYASLHGVPSRLLLLDCRTLEHREVPLPEGLAILVLDSGVRRRLADSGYNDRGAEVAAALAALRAERPDIRTLRDVTPEALELLSGMLAPPLHRRARHVVEECHRVLAGAEALERGDLAAFGRLIDESHASSRDLYEVSTLELDSLAAVATGADGCHGARLSGGGFGGCVVALVDQGATEAVAKTVGETFETRFGRRPESFVCSIADGAKLWAV